MRIYVLVAVALLGLSAFGAEKELQLADGRVLRGELMGEQDGLILLALKVDAVTANVRIAKADVLSVKDASAVQAPTVEALKAPQAAPQAQASEGDFARVKRLLAAASQESTTDYLPVPDPSYGYPYPTWQHWPWTFTINRQGWWSGWWHHGGHWSGHSSHSHSSSH